MTSISLYLDVDGVVCPFGPAGNTDWGTDFQHAGIGLMEVHYAAELVTELNRLSHLPGMRFVWLTSWEGHAPKYLCRAIGLDGRKWPVLRYGDQRGRYNWWKLEAIQRDIAKHEPWIVVWIDDQLPDDPAADAWLGTMGGRILGISPDPRNGISRAELAGIESFLDAGTGEHRQHGER